jgi:hypothetical protein
MLTSVEDTLIAWNTCTQEDLKEVVKLWGVIQEMKAHGHSKMELVVQDGEIVHIGVTKKWRNTGVAFVDSELTI